MTAGALAGLTILVVEDEFLVSAMLVDALEDEGGTVIGPAATLAEGLRLVAQGGFDVAVLDWNLDGQCSAPIARALGESSIPTLVATGYGQVDAEFSDRPVLSKPFDLAHLVARVQALAR